jgi:hypothetical protein
MSEIDRLLERPQSGWQPTPDGMRDTPVHQWGMLTGWSFATSFTRPESCLIGRPRWDQEMVLRTDPILWIDAGLAWALVEDGFWWLE